MPVAEVGRGGAARDARSRAASGHGAGIRGAVKEWSWQHWDPSTGGSGGLLYFCAGDA
jgi:hypothetical protein